MNISSIYPPIIGSDGRYYFLYLTINLVNNKYYKGKKTSITLNCQYLGSGKIISDAILKYRRENFCRCIVGFYNNSTELNEAEKIFITKEDIESLECYNLAPGGQGGSITKGYKHSEHSKSKMRGKRDPYPKPSIELCIRRGLAIKNSSKHQEFSKRMKGIKKPKTLEHIEKHRQSYMNSQKYNSTLEKLQEASHQKFKCSHCEIITTKANLSRWHNDKCKFKQVYQEF